MEFAVFRSDLLKELELVQGATEKKASVPVLSNVLIDAQNGKLALSATNLAIGLCSYAVAAIKTPGSVTVPARRSLEILRSLPEADIRFKALENHWVQVTTGRSSFKMTGIAGDSFPKFPEVPKTNVTVPSETLAAMLRRTAFAVSNDEGRFTLNAVLFVAKGNCIRMVATDGFRLALVEKEVAGPNVAEELRVLIPKEAAHQLCVLLTLRKQDELTGIAKDEQHLFFTQNERVLVSRALAGPSSRTTSPSCRKTTAPLKPTGGRFCGPLSGSSLSLTRIDRQSYWRQSLASSRSRGRARIVVKARTQLLSSLREKHCGWVSIRDIWPSS